MAFHLYHITELFSNADGTVQYIELQGELNGQNVMNTHTITSTQGGTTNTFTFDKNLPNTVTNGKTILIATQGFADLGIVTPDYIIPSGFLFTDGGTVDFNGDATHDLVTYTSLPTDGVNSLNYVTAFGDTGTVGVGTPTNFAGGTGGADNLVGINTLGDTMAAGSGNDTIDGLGGADSLLGQIGDDFIKGAAGNDTLVGGDGDDTLEGGAGSDTLSYAASVAAVTVLNGGGTASDGLGGTDTLVDTFERVIGSAFDDTLAGGNIEAGLGNDSLDGSVTLSADSLQGGLGDDWYVFGPEDFVVENPGEGTDTVLIPVSFTLGANFENLTLQGLDAIDGTGNELANFITGNSTVNTLAGNDGNDTLDGGEDTDFLSGGAGDDSIFGAIGVDTLWGGAGNDTLNGSSSADYILYTDAPGAVTVDLFNITALDGEGGTDVVTSVEHVVGSDFGDTIIGHGAANSLSGGLGDDSLDGGDLNDTLTGGRGVDSLAGGDGDDLLVATPTATADASGITFVADVVSENPAEGLDTVSSNSSFTLPDEVENLILTGAPFWRAYVGTGNALDNVITGEGDARHNLSGKAGADTLDGGGGKDTLAGGAGADVLVHDAADASIDGGLGDDTLRLDGAGVALDLAGLAGTVIEDIEIIDLTGTGDNTLTLALADALAISSTTDTLRVDGNAGDAVVAGTGWAQGADTVIGAQTYAQYTQGSATLQVDTDVDRSGILLSTPPPSVIALDSLDGANGLRMDGIASGDQTGHSVASAGDVNGDGYDDLIVGASMQSNGYSGVAYVVFGGTPAYLDTLHGASGFDLSALDGANGFRLDGISNGDLCGISVASAGDMNGDGFADLIIGASGAVPGYLRSGEVYVVYGQNDWTGTSGVLGLSTLDGVSGFRLNGFGTQAGASGYSVDSAGDVNGDGFADMIFGAPSADPNFDDNAGAGYVIFGKDSGFGPVFDLNTMTAGDGARYQGTVTLDGVGTSVASAGDVNGDGYDDLIIGALGVDYGGSYAGASYVVFGGGGASQTELSALDGSNGFRLDGIAGSFSGRAVSSAGDLNGDGYADVIVGAPFADPVGGGDAGESYVVFGQTDWSATSGVLGVSSLDGTNGLRLGGVGANDWSGHSVAAAGDVNGDGYDDLIVGAYRGDPAGPGAGESYVVFGGSGGYLATLHGASGFYLDDLDGTNGFRLDGVHANDASGISVAAAGDVNGDGFGDLIVGADFAYDGSYQPGASYVVFGRDFNGVVDFLGTAGADSLSGGSTAEVFVGGLGNDTIVGNGGADVFRGGEGDDRIVVSDTGFFDADGGTGSDTLALDGGGIALDLTLIADSKLTGVEIIELTGSGNNTLTLSTLDVLNLSDSTNTLRVDGDAVDAVSSTGQGWVAGGTVEVFSTVFYQSYSDGAATLLLHPDLVAGSTIN